MRGIHRNRPLAGGGEGIVIVWGLLAREPYGGMAWQVLHYLAGLQRLGFDVWYVEDCDALPSHPVTRCRTTDPTENLTYLRKQLEFVGLEDHWAYRRPMSDEVLGAVDAAGLQALYRRSVAVLNLCGSHVVMPNHLEAPNLVYVETDPFFAQILAAQGDEWLISQLRSHHHLFSYGLNLGTPLCQVPVEGYVWNPTVPPVVTEWWAGSGEPTTAAFTTVANLRHTAKDVVWGERMWKWSKHEQFRPFIDLPARVGVPMEMALVNSSTDELGELHRHGWLTRSGWMLADPQDYRSFVQGSRGEFSVGKEQYVAPRTGWLSDRSVCYLAAGRPVVVEDTGAGCHIPTGWGLVTFSDLAGAVAGIERVCSDSSAHSWAAAELAHEYFEAERVLSDLMEVALAEPRLKSELVS